MPFSGEGKGDQPSSCSAPLFSEEYQENGSSRATLEREEEQISDSCPTEANPLRESTRFAPPNNHRASTGATKEGVRRLDRNVFLTTESFEAQQDLKSLVDRTSQLAERHSEQNYDYDETEKKSRPFPWQRRMLSGSDYSDPVMSCINCSKMSGITCEVRRHDVREG
jgi:hypothetical protein